MRIVVAMALKDLRLLFRDKAGLFFVVGFPFFYALLLGSIFSTGSPQSGSMKVMVVDLDQTEASESFIAELSKQKVLELVPSELAEAEDNVRLGKVVAYVAIPEGYGARPKNPLSGKPGPEIELGVDPSRSTSSGMLRGLLMGTAFRQMATSFQKAAKSKDATKAEDTSQEEAWAPLTIRSKSVSRKTTGPKNGFEFAIPQGMIWAMLFCMQRFSTNLVGERERQTLLRMQLAPISRLHILGGKALICFGAILLVAISLAIFSRQAMDVQISSFLNFAIALLSAAVCFSGIMVFVAVLGKTENGVGGISTAIMMLMAMSGGGMVPLIAMPGWMQSVGSVSPVKWAILGIEGSIWRDYSTVEILTPSAILLVIGVTCFAIGARVFRWEE